MSDKSKESCALLNTKIPKKKMCVSFFYYREMSSSKYRHGNIFSEEMLNQRFYIDRSSNIEEDWSNFVFTFCMNQTVAQSIV